MASKGKPGGGGNEGDDSVVLKGSRGDDQYFIASAGVSIDERNNGGTDSVIASVSYILDPNVEHLTLEGLSDLDGTGNELDNRIIGNDGANTLSGLAGNDEIDGGAGNDTLLGGSGDDLLNGGDGSDLLDGGDGTDTARLLGLVSEFSFSWSGDELLITDLAGNTDVYRNVEYLAFDDKVIATADIQPGSGVEPMPEANDDAASGSEDNSVVIDVLTNDTGSGLMVTSVTAGSLGTATINADQTITYTPSSDASGSDVFSYTVTDGAGNTSTAQITVTVAAVNDAPDALADSYVASQGAFSSGSASVLDNDSDRENDTMSVVGYEAATAGGGIVQMNTDGTFQYAAAAGFSGTDTFRYTVSDGQGGSSQTVVSIEVAGGEAEEPPYYVTGVIRGEDVRVNPDDPIGTGTTVYFAFAEQTPDYYYSGSFAWSAFEPFSDAMKAATRKALLDISSHTEITFVETSVENAGMVLGVAELGASVEGVGYYPDAYTVGTPTGDLWIDNSLAGLSFDPGSHDYLILLHEIGHTLGLTHPTLPYEELNCQYTVMADHEHPTFASDGASMMLYDIAALQYLYGANTSATAGDDVYAFDALTETLQTIWDAGGHDTIDLSAATRSVSLDLNAGAFSTVSATGTNNVALAFGTIIEDAIGSGYDDTIIGNEGENVMFGGAGNDVMTGGAGGDSFVFEGGSGFDVITDFAPGEDVLFINGPETSLADLTFTASGGDLLVEHSGGTIQLEGVDGLSMSDIVFGLA